MPRDLIDLSDQPVHLIRKYLLIPTVNDLSSDLVGKRHTRYQEYIGSLLLHGLLDKL